MSDESRTFLDMAKENLKINKAVQIAYPSDDGLTNYEGYHCQQAIELSLKHLLETHGIQYPKTHEIGDLIRLIPEKYQDIVKDISLNSRMITHLEADTRYKKNYKASRDLVNTASKLAYNLIKNIEFLEAKEKIEIEKQVVKYEKEFQNNQGNKKDKLP